MDFVLLLGLAALAAVLVVKGVLWARKQDRSGKHRKKRPVKDLGDINALINRAFEAFERKDKK